MESTNNTLKSDFALDLNLERRLRGLAAAQLVLAFKVAALNRIVNYAKAQLKKPVELASLSRPRPTPQNQQANPEKTRSRDRNGRIADVDF